MKSTDYSPRAAFMDTLLKGINLAGIEVGADNGAHCEALLKHCSVNKLIIIDIWDNPEMKGYCRGRLESQGYKQNILLIQGESHITSSIVSNNLYNFVYIDITHDYFTVKKSLEDWWPKLKEGGILGYRNYAESNVELKKAVDEFTKEWNIPFEISAYHNEIVLFK